MKVKLLVCIFTSILAVPSIAPAASVQGTWRVQTFLSGYENDQTCNFIQDGQTLTGSCKGTSIPTKIVGKIKGKRLSWTYKVGYNDKTFTMTYTGVLVSATKMTGSVGMEKYADSEGDFSATFVK